MSKQVIFVAADGVARLQSEAARLAAIKVQGAVPAICGDAIPQAPARGAFRVFEPQALYPDGEGDFEARSAGYRGRSAIQRADVFDVMAAKAARHNKASPLSAGQVAIGRHYRDLVERHSCAGLKCSSIEAIRSGGSGRGGDFMDAVLRDRDEIKRLRRRIGTGSAMVVRRIRPSKRGSRVSISDLRLVDMVCLEDRALSDVLKAHGWSVYGDTSRAVAKALGLALGRMSGGYAQETDFANSRAKVGKEEVPGLNLTLIVPPIAAVQNLESCRSTHHAAFSEDEGRQSGRSGHFKRT